MKRTLFLILIALCPLAADAQTLVQKADSLLDLHYNRLAYDTAYILRPERRWTFKLRPLFRPLFAPNSALLISFLYTSYIVLIYCI